jgi:intracellular septation protein
MSKLLFDLFPVILFFAAFKLSDIYIATGVAMAATGAQIAWVWWRHRKVETMQWVSLGLILVLGGATLLAHSETFIKWKPTVLYWVMGAGLLVSQWAFGKNGIKALMGAQIQLPDPVWQRLSAAWALFFLAMGVLNLWVAYAFSTNIWVNFKLFGGIGLMVVFVIGQSLYISRHLPDEEAADKPADSAAAEPRP